MKIYNAGNKVIASVPVSPDAVHEEELMKSDFVRLTWYGGKRAVLPVGSYIVPFADGVRYTLLDPYTPGRERHRKFKYEPEFQHPVMWLGRIPFFHLQGDTTSWETATKKVDWTYTGYAPTIANELVGLINWLSGVYPAFGNVFGRGWTAAVADNLPTTKTCTFSSVDILSAAAEMASQWNCEYHFDFTEKKFHFGTVSYNRGGIDGTQLLKSGENVQVASVSAGKESYYNSFVVLGSTKNLSQQNAAGENVQVTERLTLGDGYPDSMIYVDNDGGELTRAAFLAKGLPLLTKELVLDDVYPKLQLYVYDVRERRRFRLDENGQKIADKSFASGYREYSQWYLRLAHQAGGVWTDYTVSDGDRIADTELQISFLPNYDSSVGSPLAGRTFEVVAFTEDGKEHDPESDVGTGMEYHSGDYRIVFEDGDLIIPTTKEQGLYPRTVAGNAPSTENNIVSVIGVAVSDGMKKTAQDELRETAMGEIARLFEDLNTYTMKSNAVSFRKSNPGLHIGQSVTWSDGQDLNGGKPYVLNTHVRKLVTRLDNPDIVEITIGNEKTKGTISTMKEQIETIIAGGYGNGDGGGGLTERQFMQLLQTYGSRLFLSRKNSDHAEGRIAFWAGVLFGREGLWGVDGDGRAVLREMSVGNLTVTGAAHFMELVVDKVKSAGGQLLLTATGCVVDGVETGADFSRLYFRAEDADGRAVTNDWEAGDQLLCATMNAAEGSTYAARNKLYWGVVRAKGTTEDGRHYIDVPLGVTAGDFEPAEGDNIVQCGWREGYGAAPADVAQRRSALYLAAYNSLDAGLRAPLMAFYEGIRTFELRPYRTTYKDAAGGLWTGEFRLKTGKTVEEALDDMDPEQHLPYIDGFLLQSAGGNTHITPESIGTYDEFRQQTKTTVGRTAETVCAIEEMNAGPARTQHTFYFLLDVAQLDSGVGITLSNLQLSFVRSHQQDAAVEPYSLTTVQSRLSLTLADGTPTGSALTATGTSVAGTVGTLTTSRQGRQQLWVRVQAWFYNSVLSQFDGLVIARLSLSAAYANTNAFARLGYDGYAANFGQDRTVYFGQEMSVLRYGNYALRLTTGGIRKSLDGGSTWQSIDQRAARSVSTSVTLTENDSIVLAGSSTAITLTLPTVSYVGHRITIIRTGTATVNVYGYMNGQTRTLQIKDRYEIDDFYWQGSMWISGYESVN